MLSRLQSRLLSLLPPPRCDVLFLSSSPVDDVWVRSTALACRAAGLEVRVAICGGQAGSSQSYAQYRSAGIPVDIGIPFAKAARIDCKVAVTASSGLNRKIFPSGAAFFVHMPHSLASLHMIYPQGAFDGYDVLFAAGPQHMREFAALSGRNGTQPRRAFPVGYGKLDALRQELLSRHPKHAHHLPRILIAPSWGPDNLLDKCGVALARELAALGMYIVIRPHPLFFLDKAPVMQALQALVASDPHISLESPFDGDAAIFDADLLIGDYSGISFEFAALRRCPVVSVNVGLKIANPRWEELQITPVEISCRSDLGPVVAPEIDAIVAAVRSRLPPDSTATPCDTEAFLYGQPGECAAGAVPHILRLLEESKH